MTIHIIRAPGIMSEKLSDEDARRFRDEAVSHSDGSARAEAAIATATACCSRGEASEWELSRRAVELARDVGDGCLESAAIDQLCAVELTRDDLPETVRLIRRRGEVIDGLPVEAASAMEHLDFRLMGSEVLLAAGDLEGAGRHADILAALPFVRGDDHVAVARRVKVDSLAGRFDDAVEQRRTVPRRMVPFRPAAGVRPRPGRRTRWRWSTASSATTRAASGGARPRSISGCRASTSRDAVRVGLRRSTPSSPSTATNPTSQSSGSPPISTTATCGAPGTHDCGGRGTPRSGPSPPSLAGLPDADHRLARGRDGTRDNPIARTIVERAVAIRSGDGAALERCATEFERLGCPYQHGRTRELAAGG